MGVVSDCLFSFAVSQDELGRLQEAFDRYSYGSSRIDEITFRNMVLGELFPKVWVPQLYYAMGGSSKGVTYRELLSAVAILIKGSIEERALGKWPPLQHRKRTPADQKAHPGYVLAHSCISCL